MKFFIFFYFFCYTSFGDNMKIYRDYDKVPPIVSEEIWNRVNIIINDKKRHINKYDVRCNIHNITAEVYLSKFLRYGYMCKKCSGEKSGKIRDRFDLTLECIRRYYIDRKKSKCVNLHLAEEKEYIREIYLKNKGSTLFDLYMAMSHYYCHYKSKFEKLSNADIRFDFAMCGYFYKLQDYGNYLKNIFYKFS